MEKAINGREESKPISSAKGTKVREGVQKPDRNEQGAKGINNRDNNGSKPGDQKEISSPGFRYFYSGRKLL